MTPGWEPGMPRRNGHSVCWGHWGGYPVCQGSKGPGCCHGQNILAVVACGLGATLTVVAVLTRLLHGQLCCGIPDPSGVTPCEGVGYNA